MKWLTLTLIKQQLRLEQDYHDEDALLELYGGSAENTILQCTNRTVDELKALWEAITPEEQKMAKPFFTQQRKRVQA